jgi:hypothetical protein
MSALCSLGDMLGECLPNLLAKVYGERKDRYLLKG